jgi:hypothetical protein
MVLHNIELKHPFLGWYPTFWFYLEI